MTTEELRLASDAEGRSSLGVLHGPGKLAQLAGFFQLPGFLTLNANSARPTVRPGRGWYRVPALATTASLVVGPWASREATLRPVTSEVSYDPVDAAAAKVRRWTRQERRAACCAVRARDDLEIIMEGDGVGNWQSFGRRGEAIDLQKKCLVEKLPSNFRATGNE